jgi:hypothetical protein
MKSSRSRRDAESGRGAQARVVDDATRQLFELGVHGNSIPGFRDGAYVVERLERWKDLVSEQLPRLV